MNIGELAAYQVADHQRQRFERRGLFVETAKSFTKLSFNLLCIGLTVATGFVLTLAFWPLAVVFLLFIIAFK